MCLHSSTSSITLLSWAAAARNLHWRGVLPVVAIGHVRSDAVRERWGRHAPAQDVMDDFVKKFIPSYVPLYDD